jgi:hypothetical protein
MRGEGGGNGGTGHCCLSSWEVRGPVEGRWYSGLGEEGREVRVRGEEEINLRR